MKKLSLFAFFYLLAAIGMAQVEYVYDFNSLTEGSQNLNGQDGWKTHYQTATSSQDFDVSYVCDEVTVEDLSGNVLLSYHTLPDPKK